MHHFTFIDLFSGIGGFHQAMSALGGECVFAAEIDKYAIETYYENYRIDSSHNICKVNEKDIPPHDVLCAGFPCQSFSKSGKRLGFADETKGTLFFEIERILKHHKTKYIILENVRNLVSHDSGNTWNVITTHLKQLGYRLTEKPLILSPHQFGIPQLRERVIILGKYEPENIDKPLNITFGHLLTKNDNDIHTILETGSVSDKYQIDTETETTLQMWDDFYQGIQEEVIGFPIWVDAFSDTPLTDPALPKWKNDFLMKNFNLYQNNKQFIDKWMQHYDVQNQCSATVKKMEWQAGNSIGSLWEGIIQSRPSGIRVKVPNCFPALVAIVQIPIIGELKRKLTVREAARLQSFPDTFIPNKNDLQAYKQFGNSVNVTVIKECASRLFLN